MNEALLGFAIGLVLSVVATRIAESATGFHDTSSSAWPVAVTAADVAGLWVGLVAAAVWASRVHGTGSLVRDFGYRVGPWWDVPFGAVVGLLSQYVLIPVLYYPFEKADRTLSHQLGVPAQRETAAAHTSWSVVALIVVLAVGAPLVEELFFRGLILRGLTGRMPPYLAIGVSAVLFGLAHFEAVQFAGLTLFGAVLGFLAWRTGRLAPSISAHMAFNTAAVLSVVHTH